MDDSLFEIFDDEIKLEIPRKFIKEKLRTKVTDEFFTEGTKHEAIVPCGIEYTDIPHEPVCDAKKYKFELDTFQKISISSIERDESVLVSAHTSCGKTVVAEYAIAKSIKNRQRVVYTSPIKALSNQKYRELQVEFEDVGLMTGDVTINPEASCLVMTTEILRNMLYRGSEVIREVHWIVFDEIHYMRDKERGVVWEETIILLPRHIRMVFLSATIPNALEFAEWIAHIQQQVVHVVYTEKRIIPLVHYFLTDEMYLVKDGKFHLLEFKKSMQAVPSRKDVEKLLQTAIERASHPAVVFSFSRKECENYAVKVKKDLLDDEEKELVKTIFDNAIASLREEDRQIPIIVNMLPLLQRGIGIHHSGLLPIIREIVEILFQESLLKVLFATETFSIGLNMPAKTVIFTSLRKFDGSSRRLLTSGEFIQMSGRAGRRGLDDLGVVISILSEELTASQVKTIFSSNSDKLLSAFRLTYNMILNLLRVEGLDPEYMLSKSFYHFQAYKNVLEEESKIKETKHVGGNRLSSLLLEREMLYRQRNKALYTTHSGLINSRGRVVDFMIPKKGTLLLVHNAIVKSVRDGAVQAYILTNRDIEVKEYPQEWISCVYNVQCKPEIKTFSKKYKAVEYQDPVDDRIEAIEEMIRNIVPSIDFSACLQCKSVSRACLTECVYRESGIKLLDQAAEHLRYLIEEEDLQEKIVYLEKLKEIYHMNECKKMIEVLRRLNYIDCTSVCIKGKMASEISAGDELVITEMIFNSGFNELNLVEMVALLSCFVCEEKTDDITLSEENDKVYNLLVKAAERVVQVMNDCGIEEQPETYIKRLSYGLMDIVRMWMGGRTFIEICESTAIFEGSIIRGFKRLEELLRQLSSAAAVIGNNELVDLFTQGIFMIKRDIIFANSLYL
ncbi:ATP-dependent RNA helicase mtr4 [Glugoides intestinalis]